jgi:type I restriction enzyme S subunit
MTEWPLVSLGSLASSHRGSVAIGPFGSAMKADTYSLDGVPVIRGTNISDTRAWKGAWVFIPEAFADAMPRCVVRAGALVFPHHGSIGEVAIVPGDRFARYFLSTSLTKIEIDPDKADPLFVYFFFRSIAGRQEILRYASQVGTPGIGQPLESLRKLRLPLPPLAVQHSIASVLGAFDEKIDLNRRMNETLEAIARAIFKDWFVDFGPTRAKMEAKPPYMPPEIWSLFRMDLMVRESRRDG